MHNDDVADLIYGKEQEIADLVAKLREFAVEPARYWLDNYARQGADEIERLRTENQELQDAILHFETRITELQTELTRVERAYSNGL
jgi:predicted RNase H-like nuclease (RuvC/YqgF family)